jgi:predicted O-methyltransferase YrrM
MKSFLNSIPNGSVVLDIGIGTCYAYTTNHDILKSKSIKIVGVDIDSDYINIAKHGMIDADLESHVKRVLSDIYKVTSNVIVPKSFDYVIFSDSYSVIPNVHQI